MKSIAALSVCALFASLSTLSACSGGGSSNANDQFVCEKGESYGIINGRNLAAGNILSESTVLISHQGDAVCTGTLIDTDKVLTAAHCTSRDSSEITYVVFTTGIGCLKNANKDTVLRASSSRVVNSQYTGYRESVSPSDATNDLAIIKFEGGLPPGYAVRPLPAKDYDPTKAKELVFSGFGRTTDEDLEKQDRTVGTLRYTTGDIGRLKRTFSYAGLNDYSVSKTLIAEQPSNGVCTGDSGGPLYAKNANGTLTLIGVTSMVADLNATRKEDLRMCHGISIFVDVREQLDWIRGAMKKLDSEASRGW